MVLSPFADQAVLIRCQKLQRTDISRQQDCLVWNQSEFDLVPLFALLTTGEIDAVFEEGLGMQAFDKHGREYNMVFRFHENANICCLCNQWSRFLQENRREIKAGDNIKIWALNILKEDGSRDICLRLLHCNKEEGSQQKRPIWSVAEDELRAAEALLLLKSSK